MRSTSEYTHKSLSPIKRVMSPVRQKVENTPVLQSALKKRNNEFERATSAGGFSDHKSFAGGRSDSPLKQA